MYVVASCSSVCLLFPPNLMLHRSSRPLDDDDAFDLRQFEPKGGGYDQLNNNKHLSFMDSIE